ncbi:MAG: tetratricopeptide repeat protein [Thermomicrobiales bacterium]
MMCSSNQTTRNAGMGLDLSAPPLLDTAEQQPMTLVPVASPGRRLHAELPLPLTSFVGRERELASICAALRRDGVRLLTLTGPCGVGKTRLALQVAEELAGDFPDGIWFVPLAPVRDPNLVTATVAGTIGVREVAGRSILAGLQAFLRDKHALLILDNFEHVLEAAPFLSDLLAAGPRLTVFATSRVVLHVSGEHNFALPPLMLPDLDLLPPVESLNEAPAVRLFVERARAARDDFALTVDNAAMIAQICHRLDGLPLAIELAASRSSFLSPSELLARLEPRLPLLAGGPRDVPARLRTMRDAIAWSYDLLTPEDRVLFRHVAVFVGGFTLEAAEQVSLERTESSEPLDSASDSRFSVLDGISSLVDKSLLRPLAPSAGESNAATTRFGMLETIREFGLEQLAASGKEEVIRQRHAGYFLELAERSEAVRVGGTTGQGVDLLVGDGANLRAALDGLQHRGEIKPALRMAEALWPLWLEQGELTEGRARIESLLLIPGATNHRAEWARAASVAGALAQAQGDHERAVVLCERTLAIASDLGDCQTAGAALVTLGLVALVLANYAQAEVHLQESLSLFASMGDVRAGAWALRHLGTVAYRRHDLARAAALAQEGLAIVRGSGDPVDVARLLHNRGMAEAALGELKQAVSSWDESLALYQEAGDRWGVADTLCSLGIAARIGGDETGAAALLAESWALFRQVGDPEGTARVLGQLGWLARARGDPAGAAQAFDQAILLARDHRAKPFVAAMLVGQGTLAFDRGDLRGAAARWQEGLLLSREIEDQIGIAIGMEWIAHLAAATGDSDRSARLLGAAGAMRATVGILASPIDQAEHHRLETALHQLLGSERAKRAFVEGRKLSLTDAIAEATEIGVEAIGTTRRPHPVVEPPRSSLTRRELEVLRLLVEGKSDPQIAAALFISRRTAATHVANIFRKLDVTSRAAAAAYAVRNELA